MQQLRFINNPLAQNVSGIIIPTFRSARPMWFLALDVLAGVLGSRKQAVCTV